MSAWPRAHVRDGFWASSPIPGIGPRLLVLLARHRSAARRDLVAGKRARYGPSHALKDLLAMRGEDVVAAVLQPDPAWVPCSGTWHRVLPIDGSLSTIDHGEVDLTSELTAAALTGARLVGCVAAVETWSERASLVRLSWLDALASFDAAAQWGVDVLAARDAWIAARVGPSLVVSAPVTDAELLQWVTWTRDIAVMGAWKAAGWTSYEARNLTALEVTAAESVQWREAGLDVGLIGESLSAGLSPLVASAWWRAGFQPSAAEVLLALGVSLEKALDVKRHVRTAKAVLAELAPF